MRHLSFVLPVLAVLACWCLPACGQETGQVLDRLLKTPVADALVYIFDDKNNPIYLDDAQKISPATDANGVFQFPDRTQGPLIVKIDASPKYRALTFRNIQLNQNPADRKPFELAAVSYSSGERDNYAKGFGARVKASNPDKDPLSALQIMKQEFASLSDAGFTTNEMGQIAILFEKVIPTEAYNLSGFDEYTKVDLAVLNRFDDTLQMAVTGGFTLPTRQEATAVGISEPLALDMIKRKAWLHLSATKNNAGLPKTVVDSFTNGGWDLNKQSTQDTLKALNARVR